MGPLSYGDVLVALTLMAGFGVHLFYFGARIGKMEGWIREARERFDRLENKLDRALTWDRHTERRST